MHDNDYDFDLTPEKDTFWLFIAAFVVVISILAALNFITPKPSTEREKACADYSYNETMMRALKCGEVE